MAVIIALGNDKDLVFIGFQLLPEARRKEWIQAVKCHARLGSIEILENMWRSLQEAIASIRLQLCTVAIESFVH